MKKIFTLCACALLSCMSIARAESVTIYIEDEDGVEYKSQKTELTRDADGVYTIASFLNLTTCSLSFTFDESIAVDASAAIELKGNVDADAAPYYYILNENNKYPIGKLYPLDSDEYIKFRYACVYTGASYSYVTRLDKEKYGYDYYAYFSLTGTAADDSDLPWYDYYFYFNAIEDEPVVEEKPISLGNVDVDICNYDGAEVAKSYSSALNVTTDGVYTLDNFINSGASLSFTFDSSIAVDAYAAIEFKGNINSSYAPYYYVLNSNGKYPTGKLNALEGDAVTDVYYPLVYQSKSYAYVMRLDKAKYGYEYYASIYFTGLDADDKDLDDYYLEFYFNGPVTSSISTIEANDENAPIEYYNLNGQRVENPANGLFIRKQGAKVEKVVIR